ncbi:hypothetical protein [Paenibacillus sp. FSL R5-0519]|uniref:hypothetical protein n=1 Tax=Paenibacillus sp. FSL R5-0519 TaxID=2921648 RepID=UPI0030D89DFC
MAFQFSRKQIQPDTSAPTNRIAAAPFGRLSRWDVVDTVTLDEIAAKSNKHWKRMLSPFKL